MIGWIGFISQEGIIEVWRWCGPLTSRLGGRVQEVYRKWVVLSQPRPFAANCRISIPCL